MAFSNIALWCRSASQEEPQGIAASLILDWKPRANTAGAVEGSCYAIVSVCQFVPDLAVHTKLLAAACKWEQSNSFCFR